MLGSKNGCAYYCKNSKQEVTSELFPSSSFPKVNTALIKMILLVEPVRHQYESNSAITNSNRSLKGMRTAHAGWCCFPGLGLHLESLPSWGICLAELTRNKLSMFYHFQSVKSGGILADPKNIDSWCYWPLSLHCFKQEYWKLSTTTLFLRFNKQAQKSEVFLKKITPPWIA